MKDGAGWPLWPSLHGLRYRLHMHSLLVLVALTAAASASSGAAFHATKVSAASRNPWQFAQAFQDGLYTVIDSLASSISNTYWRAKGVHWGLSDVAWCGALICAIQGLVLWRMRAAGSKNGTKWKASRETGERPSSLWAAWKVNAEMEAERTDPGLLQKYSSFRTYKTSKATYPSIRTFYRPHSQADKLTNKPTPLPLLVFVHGLGGCLASFSPILTSLINIAPCFGIDLPGCGRSKFSLTSWDAYTPEALAELLSVAIEEHCSKEEGQGVVLIGHSMGCSLALLIATSFFAPQNERGVEVLGLIGVCPQAAPYPPKLASYYTRLLRIPTPIFDIIRTFDRWKGLDSPSITSFAGKNADLELRRIQMKYNRQSRTPVFRRIAWGLLPRRCGSKVVAKGIPGLEVWGSLKVPLFLVAGEADTVTKPEEIVKIGKALGKVAKPLTPASKNEKEKESELPGQTRGSYPTDQTGSIVSTTEVTMLDGPQDSSTELPNGTPAYSRKRQVLKTSILPAPASHALLYDPATYRTLAGLIQTFLSDHIDTRLSLGWQLQHLSTEGKWDVKNLVKWQAIQPVSSPIAGIFRAMKTLREIDDVHSPENFVKQWKGKIKAVVDISHESPVYDPKGLDEGGIEYHKFPTVSKIPPTAEEAQEFIKLIDKLRAQPPVSTDDETALIGVHCHYGFNRTGFFICCYLIEREKYGVQQAIDAFAKERPKGIKHAHFLDQLFVRYCVGLKKAPTLGL